LAKYTDNIQKGEWYSFRKVIAMDELNLQYVTYTYESVEELITVGLPAGAQAGGPSMLSKDPLTPDLTHNLTCISASIYARWVGWNP
jgi:hypothetical protein